MTTSTLRGQSQRNRETGEPDDATSIKYGSEGGWEKRPKGPRSQPTRLLRTRTAFFCVRFPSLFAFTEDMEDTQASALLSSPTVTHEPGLSTAYENRGAIFRRIPHEFEAH